MIADTTFLNADWQSTVLWSQNGTTAIGGQFTSGGNPDSYRLMSHSMPHESAIGVHHVYVGESYNPQTQGAIAWIDYSEDRIEFNPPFWGAAVGALFLLQQGGRSYHLSLDPNNAFTDLSWTTKQRLRIKASDFRAISGAEPDFSAAGGEIHFGVLRSNSNTSVSIDSVITHGIDNFVVTVNRDCQ